MNSDKIPIKIPFQNATKTTYVCSHCPFSHYASTSLSFSKTHVILNFLLKVSNVRGFFAILKQGCCALQMKVAKDHIFYYYFELCVNKV